MQVACTSTIGASKTVCLHQRPTLRLRRLRCTHRVRSSAEQVYKVESQLIKAGFTQDQARSLLVTGSRLSQIQRKADFKKIRSVFETSWEIEDELMQHGMELKRARHVGCMFVALAATQLEGNSSNYNTEEFWNFWDLSAASDTGDSLEAAGAPQFTGYQLAKSILNFFVLEKQNGNAG